MYFYDKSYFIEKKKYSDSKNEETADFSGVKRNR